MAQNKNLQEIARQAAATTGRPYAACHEILKASFADITETLAAGGQVRIPNFGTFQTTHRAASKGRNLQTGEAMTVPAMRLVRFRPALRLRNALRRTTS